jgi:hypothetical protein
MGVDTLDFFIREARDFKEIVSLHKYLFGPESELRAYFDDYYEKRFKCDDRNFESINKYMS